MVLLVILFVMIYNINMFQLYGYHKREYLKWMLGNSTLCLINVLEMGMVIEHNIVTLILSGMGVGIYVTMFFKPKKKPIVYTSRVLRLLITNTLLLCLITFAYSDTYKAVAGLTILEPWLLMLSDIINYPIEALFRAYYIKDAKKIIKGMPNLIVIGVTGSYGKTSTKFYLESMLKTKYNVLVTPESYNTPMGVVKTIRERLKPHHQIFICEMGARHVGDIKEICDIVNPTHGIITAVGVQHLETFKKTENILNTKFELADALPKSGVLIVNGTNEPACNKANDYNALVYYDSDIVNSEGTSDLLGPAICLPKDSYAVKDMTHSKGYLEFNVNNVQFSTRLLGEHNALNITAAYLMAKSLGVSESDIIRVVKRLEPVPHRLQMIPNKDYSIIDDAFNSNPAGAMFALDALNSMDGFKCIITPGLVELGACSYTQNNLLGYAACDVCDYIYVVKSPVSDAIISGVYNKDKLYVVNDVKEAMSHIASLHTDKHKYILIENDLPDNY